MFVFLAIANICQISWSRLGDSGKGSENGHVDEIQKGGAVDVVHIKRSARRIIDAELRAAAPVICDHMRPR